MLDSVSIIICSYNRCAYLVDTLRSLARSLSHTKKTFEIIVVNNASTDDTDAVVASFIREAPSLHLVLLHETTKGLSHARNTGLAHAKGEVICFLDDDVFVSDRWLDSVLSAFTLSPDVGCVAGQVKLLFPGVSRPGWLDSRYHGLLSEFNHGERSHVLERGRDFFGANFALTRKAAAAVGPFNTALGRKQKALLSGEDTDYSERLWKGGFSIAYSAEGYIHHRITEERLTYTWIARRYFWGGVTHCLRKNVLYPLSSIPRLITSSLLALAALFTFNKKRFILSSFRIIQACGSFYSWYFRIR